MYIYVCIYMYIYKIYIIYVIYNIYIYKYVYVCVHVCVFMCVHFFDFYLFNFLIIKNHLSKRRTNSNKNMIIVMLPNGY